MMSWYYILGIISYGIFLVQFILSFIGGDTDLDVDFDGEMDFSFSDLISFKGLIHFLMGLSSWLMICNRVTPITVLTAIIVGFGFMVVLYYVYRLAMNFSSEPTKKYGINLIGTEVTIYLTMENISDKHCICTIQNGGVTEEITCIAETPVIIGDKRSITNYKNGIYYIS